MRRAVVLAVVAVFAAGCGGQPATTSPTNPAATQALTSTSPTSNGTPSPTVNQTPTPTLDLPPITPMADAGAQLIRATPFPDFAVVAGGSLYVGGVDRGIGRFGPDGKLATSWEIPGESCAAFDVGFGSVWSATCRAPGLVRIDAKSGKLTPIDTGDVLPDSEASVGAGEGAVWMIVGVVLRELVKVDPKTNTVADRYNIAGNVTAVRAGLGGVWIADLGTDSIRRFDPASGTVVATIKVGVRPQFLTVGEGAVWVMNQVDGTVSRIDPATNTVVATIKVGEIIEGGDIATGGGFVWLRGSRTLLFKIDPATNEIVARYGPSSGSGSVAADDDAVWITVHDTTTIWRLPLR